jgi:hypothetical protein
MIDYSAIIPVYLYFFFLRGFTVFRTPIIEKKKL